MIKALVTILTKLAEAKLEKAGIETVILKNQNYFTEARKLWDAIDEDARISKTIEGKLISKIDEFNTAVLKKFPELSQKDIDDLRQAIGGSVNAGKEAVLDNSTIIKQLQESNTSLQAENASLKDQLSKVQSLITVATTTNKTEETQTAAQDNSTNSVVQQPTA
jgi:regulator of replication initiation timing